MSATLSTVPQSRSGVVCHAEKIAVLIPAWKPERVLVDLVRRLAELGFGAIIVVNDGSDPSYEHIFDELSERTFQERSRVHIIRHPVNLGKGRALKTGLGYFVNNCSGLIGIVTADADGQHSAEDILTVAEKLNGDSLRLVLGARRFRGEIPIRSLVGNIITRHIFLGQLFT